MVLDSNSPTLEERQGKKFLRDFCSVSNLQGVGIIYSVDHGSSQHRTTRLFTLHHRNVMPRRLVFFGCLPGRWQTRCSRSGRRGKATRDLEKTPLNNWRQSLLWNRRDALELKLITCEEKTTVIQHLHGKTNLI